MLTRSEQAPHPMLLVAGIGLILLCISVIAAVMMSNPGASRSMPNRAELAAIMQLATDQSIAAGEKSAPILSISSPSEKPGIDNALVVRVDGGLEQADLKAGQRSDAQADVIAVAIHSS